MNSDKHVLNSDNDHYKPNLFNNSISHDHIKNRVNNDSDDITQLENSLRKTSKENDDGLKSTETDMIFQYFADKGKMVPEQEIRYFDKDKDVDKHNTESPRHTSKKETDAIDSLLKKDNSEKAPRASDYGPSYGDGPSVPKNESIQSESEEDVMLKKLDMLRKLGELVQNGVKLSQNYNMNSDYKAMKYEYELHRGIRDKHNGVKWLSNMMLNICWGVELGNENFNPFDFKLKGWSEQLNDDIDEYYDVMGELYEKYFKSGKPIPPELKLFFMISGSAVKFHMSHSLMGGIPNINQTMNQNPELVRRFREDAVNEQIKQQREKQREVFTTAQNKQHEMARQKATDINMLKKNHEEYVKMQHNDTNSVIEQQQFQQMYEQQMLQQQMLQQQQQQMLQQQMQHQMMQQRNQQELYEKQIKELEKQLSMQRSETKSNYTNKSNTTNESKKGVKPIPGVNKTQPQQYQMPMPSVPTSLKNMNIQATNLNKLGSIPQNKMQEILRQQQIENQKITMRAGEQAKKEMNKIIKNNDDDSVSIDPNIDDIINNKFKFDDDQSKVSNASSKLSKKRKSRIRIETA